MPGIRISSSTWQQKSQDYLELGAFRCVLLRLRAAMSIARLWQGRRNEARKLLALPPEVGGKVGSQLCRGTRPQNSRSSQTLIAASRLSFPAPLSPILRQRCPGRSRSHK